MSQIKDSELYQKIQDGDQHALEQLYDRYEKILFSFSYRMTQHRESSEEVVQEVFIKVWKGQGNFNPSKGKFSSWLLTMTRNAAIDLIRKRKEPAYELEERDALVQEETSTEDLIAWKEEGAQLREAISTLREDQQRIVEAFYFKGKKQHDIAETFDIPLGTVKGRIRLALKHLRTALTEKEGGTRGNDQ